MFDAQADATSGVGYLRSLRVEQKRCLGQALQCPMRTAPSLDTNKAATHGVFSYLRSLRVEQKRCPTTHLRCPSSFQQKPAKKKTRVAEKEKIAPKNSRKKETNAQKLQSLHKKFGQCKTNGESPYSISLSDLNGWKGNVKKPLTCPETHGGKYRAVNKMYYQVRLSN